VPPTRGAETLKQHPGVKAVLAQHSESSTGVLHDVRGYAAATRGHQAITIVDAVSSLGIANLEMDAWGVDVVVAGSQKGLMLPPGLGFCALSEKAWAASTTSRLPKYYFDLAAERKTLVKNEAHFTPAVPIVVGLRIVIQGWRTSSGATTGWPAPRARASRRSGSRCSAARRRARP
jgi:aspartate aminotransferase-like enzyme